MTKLETVKEKLLFLKDHDPDATMFFGLDLFALIDVAIATKEWKEFDWDHSGNNDEILEKYGVDGIFKEADRLQANVIKALAKLEGK